MKMPIFPRGGSTLLDAVAEAPEQVTRDGRIHRLGLTPDEIVARLDPDARAFAVTNMWSFSWPLVREILKNAAGE